jgi:dihydrodipicolinate synthase/N-acetylneuraminate lyase
MVGFALKGDFLSAGQLQLKYNKFNRALFADVNPILIKALMNVEYQVKPGNTRLPLVPPEDNVLAALIKEYRALSV